MEKDKHNSSRCAAPWRHMVQNPNGEFRPCCMYYFPLEGEYKDVEEAFHSQEMEDIREKMRRGEKLKGCEKCDLDERHDGKYWPSYRNQFNTWFGQPDDLEIRSLELSTSNICNFKCMTCNERFSSMFGPTNKNELPDPSVYEHLTQLKLLGGEPFLDQKNKKILEQVPRENIELMVVSNGSIFPDDETITYLQEFKKTSINISMDGIGEVAEFVRHGTKWERIERNYRKWEQLRNHRNKFYVQPHFVFHSINAPFFEEFFEWVDMPIEEISWDFLLGPKHLNMNYLPVDVKKYIVDHNPTLEDALSKYLVEFKFDGAIFTKLMSTLKNYPAKLDEYVEFLYGRVARH